MSNNENEWTRPMGLRDIPSVVAGLAIAGAALWYFVIRDENQQPAATVQAAKVSVVGELSDAERSFAVAAVEAFRVQCKPLLKHWLDVESAEAKFKEANFYHLTDFGWTRRLAVTVVIKDDAERIPRSWRAWGHHCFYNIGTGLMRGIEGAKDPCISLCALESDGFASLRDLPDMPEVQGFTVAAGNLWDGVGLYYGEGPEKRFVGTVLGHTPDYRLPSGSVIEAVWVKHEAGTLEPKSREAIVGGHWYVKRSDPALIRMSYTQR